jgi:hypothetical protein
MQMMELFRDRTHRLVILLSLKSRNVFLYESYQLDNPQAEDVIHIIKEFSRMNLKKNSDGALPAQNGLSFGTALASVLPAPGFLYFLRRKRMNSVTPFIKHVSGSGT